jgi:hypothetical protein
MVSQARSPRLSQYVWLMRFLGALYALMAVIYYFFSSELIYLMNVGPKVFRVTQAIAEPVDHFWLVGAATLMAVLSLISFFASAAPRVRGYSIIHLLAKVLMAAGYAWLYSQGERYFAYILGFAIECAIALVVMFSLIRLAGSTRAVLESGAGEARVGGER